MPENDGVGPHVLDLDAILGELRPIQVRWNGREYHLRQIDALSPEELSEWIRLYREVTAQGDDPSAVDGERVGEWVQQMLKLLSPELAEQGLGFLPSLKVLEHYWTVAGEAIGGLQFMQTPTPPVSPRRRGRRSSRRSATTTS